MTEHKPALRPSRIVLPLVLGTALSQMGNATLYIVLPTHTTEAGIALASVGLLFGANRAIRLLCNGPIGLAYDRWPGRRLFLPALWVTALTSVLYATTRGFWPLLLARLLWGLAWSAIWVGGTAMVLAVTTERDRGRWTGVYQIGFFVGLALGTFAGGLLTDLLGYQVTMWISALLATLGSLPALVMLPAARLASTRPDLPSAPHLNWTKDRRLWVTFVVHALNEFVTNGVLAGTIALLVQALLPATDLAIGVATATGALGALRLLLSTATAPLAGVLSDRLGTRWQVVLGGLTIGVVSMAAVSCRAPLVAFAGVILGALAGASVRALLTALTGDLVAPAQRGRAIGIFNVMGDLGTAAGPVAAYALLEQIGLSPLYLACAGLYVISAILAAHLSTPSHRSPTA